ncbi:3-deoxy-D-manno-octulosonic acid transferase [candidate division KSB1 bacterium]|nr:3-deoxy-D-manno-octulosonic acid transferase [candidate division KSB1 bacterium]MBL7094029.1 3-deoxy-D-manno-octulosonic acid transferase [candidate division KSB1 bacterium]
MKTRKGLSGRFGLIKKLKNELPVKKSDRDVTWFHVSSYGEFLQAKPVLDQLKKKNPKLFIFVTVFSPSGFENIKVEQPIDYLCYLPFDRYFTIKKFISIINPKIAVIVRHDIWPNCVWLLHKKGIPLYLIDASLPKNSSRFKPLFRYLNQVLFCKLAGVFVISEEEVRKFQKLGVESDKIKIFGDTKYDQVYERSLNNEKITQLIDHPILSNKKVLVAGSTWQEDEAVLISAFRQVHEKNKDTFLIIAPHEPALKRITDIEQQCHKANIKTVRWSDLGKFENETKCLIIDRIGLLSAIYSLGDVAFVGGSFYYKIHNVLEPAVFGIPVFFGPKMTTSAEAYKLLEHEAALIVNSVAQIVNLLTKIFKNTKFAKKYGDNAKNLVKQNIGSSKRIAAFLIDKLKDRT